MTRSGDIDLEAHLKGIGLSSRGDRVWVFEVPRTAGEDGTQVDTQDRVQIGARLISELVNAWYWSRRHRPVGPSYLRFVRVDEQQRLGKPDAHLTATIDLIFAMTLS